MSKLTDLINIGKSMGQQLESVGITNAGQLNKVGSKEAWLRIKAIDSYACYNRLCALEGAIQGVRWHHLPNDIKADLKEFVKQANAV